MNQYGKTLLFGRIKKSVFLHVILAGLAGALLYGFANIVRQASFLYRESRLVDEKIRALAVRKEELALTLQELETREVMERNAKERLGLKKPGEEVVVVVPEKKKNEAAAPPKSAGSIWQNVWRFLFSR